MSPPFRRSSEGCDWLARLMPRRNLTRANRDINRMLRDDNASGTLRLKGGAQILGIPRSQDPAGCEEALVYRVGELDGVVIRVGGKDETVPVMLEGERRRLLPLQCQSGVRTQARRLSLRAICPRGRSRKVAAYAGGRVGVGGIRHQGFRASRRNTDCGKSLPACVR